MSGEIGEAWCKGLTLIPWCQVRALEVSGALRRLVLGQGFDQEPEASGPQQLQTSHPEAGVDSSHTAPPHHQ